MTNEGPGTLTPRAFCFCGADQEPGSKTQTKILQQELNQCQDRIVVEIAALDPRKRCSGARQGMVRQDEGDQP